VSRPRPLALVAATAGVALVGFLLARRVGVGVGSPQPASTETAPAGVTASSAAAPAVVGGAAPALPTRSADTTAATPPPPIDDPAPPALTPGGAARALEAISKNEQTRQLFVRLQPLGLSREQQDRVLLILGTQALHPASESPTLEALRAGGDSHVLSDEEAKRVRDERQEIAERVLRSLRPALAAVLTSAQLARAGMGGDDPAAASRSAEP
jgi:hypothetical protein